MQRKTPTRAPPCLSQTDRQAVCLAGPCGPCVSLNFFVIERGTYTQWMIRRAYDSTHDDSGVASPMPQQETPRVDRLLIHESIDPCAHGPLRPVLGHVSLVTTNRSQHARRGARQCGAAVCVLFEKRSRALLFDIGARILLAHKLQHDSQIINVDPGPLPRHKWRVAPAWVPACAANIWSFEATRSSIWAEGLLLTERAVPLRGVGCQSSHHAERTLARPTTDRAKSGGYP